MPKDLEAVVPGTYLETIIEGAKRRVRVLREEPAEAGSPHLLGVVVVLDEATGREHRIPIGMN